MPAPRQRNPEPAPEPDPAPVPDPAPAPPADSEPEWARRLRETVEGLPARLRATISDDDKSSIAESVHGLFERSGAFLRPEPAPEDNPPADDPANPNPAPPPPAPDDPGPDRRTIAEKLGFPKW